MSEKNELVRVTRKLKYREDFKTDQEYSDWLDSLSEECLPDDINHDPFTEEEIVDMINGKVEHIQKPLLYITDYKGKSEIQQLYDDIAFVLEGYDIWGKIEITKIINSTYVIDVDFPDVKKRNKQKDIKMIQDGFGKVFDVFNQSQNKQIPDELTDDIQQN